MGGWGMPSLGKCRSQASCMSPKKIWYMKVDKAGEVVCSHGERGPSLTFSHVSSIHTFTWGMHEIEIEFLLVLLCKFREVLEAFIASTGQPPKNIIYYR